jgi:hypothetical protein
MIELALVLEKRDFEVELDLTFRAFFSVVQLSKKTPQPLLEMVMVI